MNVRKVRGLELGAEEIAAFATLLPAIDSFAQQHGLEVSRVRDRDPVNPHACYFLVWRGHSPKTGGSCWISVCARDPLRRDGVFRIAAAGCERGDWEYAIDEGGDRLMDILNQARRVAAAPQRQLYQP